MTCPIGVERQFPELRRLRLEVGPVWEPRSPTVIAALPNRHSRMLLAGIQLFRVGDCRSTVTCHGSPTRALGDDVSGCRCWFGVLVGARSTARRATLEIINLRCEFMERPTLLDLHSRTHTLSARAVAIQCFRVRRSKRDRRGRLCSLAMTRVQGQCAFRAPKRRLAMTKDQGQLHFRAGKDASQ
jgi:hypothetical protein